MHQSEAEKHAQMAQSMTSSTMGYVSLFHTTLSQAMREVISIMCLLQEAADQDMNFIDSKTKVHCTFYKDNAEALKIAKVPKVKQGHVT